MTVILDGRPVNLPDEEAKALIRKGLAKPEKLLNPKQRKVFTR